LNTFNYRTINGIIHFREESDWPLIWNAQLSLSQDSWLPATDYPRASRSFPRIAGSGNEIAPGEARKCWKSVDLTQCLTDKFCQVNSNSHPATKTKHSDEKMSSKDILVLVKNMRAELLAVREECAESVKRFENKVNELNSVLEARNSKIQTLETQ
jgi:hypothetical protein